MASGRLEPSHAVLLVESGLAADTSRHAANSSLPLSQSHSRTFASPSHAAERSTLRSTERPVPALDPERLITPVLGRHVGQRTLFVMAY